MRVEDVLRVALGRTDETLDERGRERHEALSERHPEALGIEQAGTHEAQLTRSARAARSARFEPNPPPHCDVRPREASTTSRGSRVQRQSAQAMPSSRQRYDMKHAVQAVPSGHPVLRQSSVGSRSQVYASTQSQQPSTTIAVPVSPHSGRTSRHVAVSPVAQRDVEHAMTQSAQPPHDPCAQGLHHSSVPQSPSNVHGRDAQCANRAAHPTSSIASASQSAPSQLQPEMGSHPIPVHAQPRNASQKPTPRASIARHSSPGHVGHEPSVEQKRLPAQSSQQTPTPPNPQSSSVTHGIGHAMSGQPPRSSSTQKPSPEQPAQQIWPGPHSVPSKQTGGGHATGGHSPPMPAQNSGSPSQPGQHANTPCGHSSPPHVWTQARVKQASSGRVHVPHDSLQHTRPGAQVVGPQLAPPPSRTPPSSVPSGTRLCVQAASTKSEPRQVKRSNDIPNPPGTFVVGA